MVNEWGSVHMHVVRVHICLGNLLVGTQPQRIVPPLITEQQSSKGKRMWLVCEV